VPRPGRNSPHARRGSLPSAAALWSTLADPSGARVASTAEAPCVVVRDPTGVHRCEVKLVAYPPSPMPLSALAMAGLDRARCDGGAPQSSPLHAAIRLVVAASPMVAHARAGNCRCASDPPTASALAGRVQGRVPTHGDQQPLPSPSCM
jgi:hypothetical protein